MEIIATDFDGTITRASAWPEIGKPNMPLIEWLISEQKRGVKIILWTCRVGDLLNQAVEACRTWGLEFDAVNENIPEMVSVFGNDGRKIFATLYIDDKALRPDEIKIRGRKKGVRGLSIRN